MAQQINGEEVREAFAAFMKACGYARSLTEGYLNALNDLGDLLPGHRPELGLQSTIWECHDEDILQRVGDYIHAETAKGVDSELYPLVYRKGSLVRRFYQSGLNLYRKFVEKSRIAQNGKIDHDALAAYVAGKTAEKTARKNEIVEREALVTEHLKEKGSATARELKDVLRSTFSADAPCAQITAESDRILAEMDRKAIIVKLDGEYKLSGNVRKTRKEEGAERLLSVIRANPGMKTSDLVEIMGVTKATIVGYAKDLKARGLVEYRGCPRYGAYYAIDRK